MPIIQAAAEGKQIELRYKRPGEQWIVKEGKGTMWDMNDFEYRIKPERKLRPYTREEWELVDKVRDKITGVSRAIVAVNECEVFIYGLCGYEFDAAMDRFTHLDGSHCGVWEEE